MTVTWETLLTQNPPRAAALLAQGALRAAHRNRASSSDHCSSRALLAQGVPRDKTLSLSSSNRFHFEMPPKSARAFREGPVLHSARGALARESRVEEGGLVSL